MQGPWKKKCVSEQINYGKKEPTKEEFHVDVSIIREKRTIQAKIVEYMILELFSTQTINSLMDLMFNDMKGDYNNLVGELEASDSDADDDDEEEEEVKVVVPEEDDDDPTRNGVDIEDYCGLKSTLTIERIKDIFGEFMSSCAGKMKYEILQTIMVGVVFEKKQFRESFMQEILVA